jgi:hypothetical protein
MTQIHQFKLRNYPIWNGFVWGKDMVQEAGIFKWLRERDAKVISFQRLNDSTGEK